MGDAFEALTFVSHGGICVNDDLVRVDAELMALVEIPQGCSPKFPT